MNNTNTQTNTINHDVAEAARQYGAVILAAGYSSRMKAFKPLLPLGELSAVERIVETLKAVGVENILIVTGYGRENLLPIVQKMDVAEVFNEAYDKGMFLSIKAGLAKGRTLFPKARAFFLMPVDCPLVSVQVLKDMIKTADMQYFQVPTYEGKKGHPLMIPRRYIEEICAYEGQGGLKAITDRYREYMIRVPVEDEGCVLDMDTPAGYDEIKEFLRARGRREDIRELAKNRRIFLIRHGETQQHEEKMFIGQYDVPLSDTGREQMKRTASRLAAETLRIRKIYTSDLSRAVESAEIIANILERQTQAENCVNDGAIQSKSSLRILCEKVRDFREINLGSWDGQKVSDVKQKHPKEYELRGTDLFAYKIGNKAENFYDMQYRAVKALLRILQEDIFEDIVIVTHSGVIRALENNIRGLRVDDPWRQIEKGDYRRIFV